MNTNEKKMIMEWLTEAMSLLNEESETSIQAVMLIKKACDKLGRSVKKDDSENIDNIEFERFWKEYPCKEQKKAAYVGEYGALALLDYTSSAVKNPKDVDVVEELKELIVKASPKVIYTHNLADKHDTHVGVVTKVISALRELPDEFQPEKLYGCEVWRNLDWVNDEEKVSFDVSERPNLAAALVEVFDSQICGGKRYDLATAGRRVANATYAASHGVDKASAISHAMDLTPLIKDKEADIKEFIKNYINRFSDDVMERLDRVF